MTTQLYRAYAENGDLLYVGVTSDPNNRMAVHQCSTPWWGQVGSVVFEDREYTDREEAFAAERAAIQAEHPYYNKEHKLPGCGTCGSPSPTLHPVEGFTAVIDGRETFIGVCTDPYHHPGDEAMARIHN